MSLSKISTYKVFYSLVLGSAIIMLIWGLGYQFSLTNPSMLILLVLLAIASSYVTSSLSEDSGGSITYEVGTSISLSAVPTFGVGGAMLIVIAASLAVGLIQPGTKTNWSSSKLYFNASMHTISIGLAGWILDQFQTLISETSLLYIFAPWLIASVAYAIVNTWLLATIIRLKHGTQTSILTLVKDETWATLIDIAIMCVGGIFLAYAIDNYDVIGVLTFFLPILLTAFAFRVYVSKMTEHMSNLESIIDERTQSLKKVMEEKDHFLAVLTHDMKTPLTTINLYSSMLMKRPETIIKKPKIPRAIYDSQKYLTDIVENILDLEKLNVDGEIALNKESFELPPLLESLVDALSAQAERKNINLASDLQGLSIPVSADRGKITRVFQNVLSNAIKYTPNSGNVNIRGFIERKTAIVQFQDSGYGIPKEDLPFIFDRFKRIDKHQKLAPGTGLGLAITKALVEAHGGKIEVSSVVNIGTCFTIRLPLSDQPEEEKLLDKVANFELL